MADAHRLLVLAGAALADLEELPPSVGTLIDTADEVFVLTPTLTSRLQWLVSDIDRAHGPPMNVLMPCWDSCTRPTSRRRARLATTLRWTPSPIASSRSRPTTS
jgi:hypothetical protein